MFRNDKKGRLYGVKKDTTFVENPPLEDNTTKVTRSINFSKSNFLNLGKWILIIVLFLYFGSYTINGFIVSNITKDSTEDIITYEYQKQIGTEIIGGNFDFIDSIEDLNSLLDKKIYLKTITLDDLLSFPYFSNVTYLSLDKGDTINWYIRFYDSNDNYLFTGPISSNRSSIRLIYLNYDYSSYVVSNCEALSDQFNGSTNARYLYYRSSNNSFSFNLNGASYFILDSSLMSFTDKEYNYDYVRTLLNFFFIFGESYEVPIYETTTYTYQVKDINYNWDYKLKQISKFRPLFNSKDLFVNEEFYKYSNLITYEFKNTDIEKENVVNKYKSDERLKILFDNESITIKGREYNFHLIKDKKDYISYINFDYSKIDMLDENVYNAYMYALENYVNNNNIDDYFIYSKMNFDAKDLLILMSFPLQLVVNTLYNFGVLVGIIVLW